MRGGNNTTRTISRCKCLLVAIVLALVTLTVLWVNQAACPPIELANAEEDFYKDNEQSISVSQHHNFNSGNFAFKHNNSGLQTSQVKKGEEESRPRFKSSSKQIAKYKAEVEKARDEAFNLISSPGWSKYGGDTATGMGIVYRKSTKKWGSIFKLEGTVDIDVCVLYGDMINNTDKVSDWNPSVLEEYVLEELDNSTDMSYNVAASAMGITSRDFVYLRHWEKKDGWYCVTSVSTTHPSAPIKKGYIRGRQNPTLIRMKELSPHKLHFEWLLNLNFMGSVPTFLVNSALPSAMTGYLKDLRAHAVSLQTKAAHP